MAQPEVDLPAGAPCRLRGMCSEFTGTSGSDHFNFRLVLNATHTRPERSAPDSEVAAQVTCERANLHTKPYVIKYQSLYG